jgi:hypothetical protein
MGWFHAANDSSYFIPSSTHLTPCFLTTSIYNPSSPSLTPDPQSLIPGHETPKSYQNVTLSASFCAIVGIRGEVAHKTHFSINYQLLTINFFRRTFTTYRLRLSNRLVVANFTQLQLQLFQLLQHLRGNCYSILAGVHQSDTDDISDNSKDSHILILITFLIAVTLCISSG